MVVLASCGRTFFAPPATAGFHPYLTTLMARLAEFLTANRPPRRKNSILKAHCLSVFCFSSIKVASQTIDSNIESPKTLAWDSQGRHFFVIDSF